MSRAPFRSHRPRPVDLLGRAGLVLLLIAPLAFAAACVSPGVPPPPNATQPYAVGPPDQLTITILPEPQIQRDVVVRPDGMISVDLIGDIPASGRTTSDIAADIEKRIGRYKRDARVTVALKSSLSSQVTVLGEVMRPSTFPLSRETRISEALGTVGGTARFAARNRIRVIRHQGEGTSVYNVDMASIERGDLSTNMLLQGGDIIYVPSTGIATVGYALQSALFPLHQLLGFGASVTTTVFTGGL